MTNTLQKLVAQSQRYRVLVCVLIVLLLTGSAVSAQEGSPAQTPDASGFTVFLPVTVRAAQTASSSFEDLATDLIVMEQFFSGGDGVPVTFDAEAAREGGFSEESVLLATELASLTNEIVAAGTTSEGVEVAEQNDVDQVSLEEYARATEFFALATEYSLEQEETVDAAGWCSSALSDKACSCGHWWYPRPTRAAPWKEWTVSNATNTLKSWGYHETPRSAGGGWTRDQTYYESRCGRNTFRDHAYTLSTTKLREQNYNGYTPRGEPNPEVWRTGPWPYATWPAYVMWWHDTH